MFNVTLSSIHVLVCAVAIGTNWTVRDHVTKFRVKFPQKAFAGFKQRAVVRFVEA